MCKLHGTIQYSKVTAERQLKDTVLKQPDEGQTSNAVVQQEQFGNRRNEAGRTELENRRNGAVQAERACEQSKESKWKEVGKRENLVSRKMLETEEIKRVETGW